MADTEWEPPHQFSPSDNLHVSVGNDYYHPEQGPGVEDHRRVFIYNLFLNETTRDGSSGGALAIDSDTSGNQHQWQQSSEPYYPQPGPQAEEPAYVPDQFSQYYHPLPHYHASNSDSESADPIQHTTVDPSQTVAATHPLPPNLEAQYPFHTEPATVTGSQPLASVAYPTPIQPDPSLHLPLPQQQINPIYPPVYLARDNVPATHLVPPAYNYVATGHPSSVNNVFFDSLIRVGAHRLAYIFMDASSAMWSYTCNKVIGKGGPTEILIEQMINNAGFRRMLNSPHLQTVNCTVTVHVPESPGGRQIVAKSVPADPSNADFMQAFHNALRSIPDCVYGHLWTCSRHLLQPSDDSEFPRRRGIFPTVRSGASLNAGTWDKLRWAFEQNDEWGFGIFHEIIEDENGFHPGRWFHNIEFINLLQEGMFDASSPGWFGFIESTTDMNSSWKMMECPTAHIFAVAISWLIVTARCDFLRTRAVALDWVSNTRIEEVKSCTRFLETWLTDFWRKSGGGSQVQSERAEGIAFMLRHAPSPLQAV